MTNSIVARYDENFELMLKFASSAGFGEVMVGFGESKVFESDTYEKEVEKMGELLNKYSLRASQTHLPCYHLLDSSEIVDEKTEMSIRRGIWASGKLGSDWTAFHPRSAVNKGCSRGVSFEDNRRMLEIYLEDAEKAGVGIAVENMPLYPHSHNEWRFFGGGWEELCELCEVLKSPRFGICWDFGHAHTAGIDQKVALREVGSLLKMTHVHDNYKNGDQHQLPGLADRQWNSIGWVSVMQTLKSIGYEGTLALETIMPPICMCENFFKLAFDSLEYLKSL
ncbi:MAG: sugar phosphate isomerase/epimerase [Clostridia bacterium]|nr:sugar phosphate isomerase/epimerase [Clostridia bacterium]